MYLHRLDVPGQNFGRVAHNQSGGTLAIEILYIFSKNFLLKPHSLDMGMLPSKCTGLSRELQIDQPPSQACKDASRGLLPIRGPSSFYSLSE